MLYLKLSFVITSLHCLTAAQKTPFLQQACHRMILQIVETGFPAHSPTATQHTCCHLPVYMLSGEVNPVYYSAQ